MATVLPGEERPSLRVPRLEPTSALRRSQPSRRWVSAAVLLAAHAELLTACAEQDITLATGVPDPVRVPLPAEPAPPLAMVNAAAPPALAPDANAGVAVMAAPPLPAPAGASAEPVPAPPALVLQCDALPPAPLAFETLEGFAESEDFAFDAQGNYVGIDEARNLVRISSSGVKQLWAPATGTTAGMAVLPDGSLVVCQVDKGELRRIHVNGSSTVVLGGLSYPNGLTLGPDGYVYVAENAGGRVRRVNPDTGEFSIVALGLYGANGVAFGTDPSILYVGSFEGSGVYRVDLGVPGELGSARVFASTPGANLPEPKPLCRDLQEGDVCESEYHTSARCQALGNVVDCVAIDPCPELADGDLCTYPTYGECQDGRCVFIPDACETGQEGDVCRLPGLGAGQCRWYVPEAALGETGEEVLFCKLPNPCEGLQPGDACQGPYVEHGECIDYGEGELGCSPRDPCKDQLEGAACVDPFGDYTGTCVDIGGGTMYCSPPTGCEDEQLGEPCTEPLSETPGTCLSFNGRLQCTGPTGCEDKAEAEACVEPGSDFEGICVDHGGTLLCSSPTGCELKQVGDTCVDPTSELPGLCVDYDGWTFCSPPTGCEGKEQGQACVEPSSGVAGTCLDYGTVLYCIEGDRCEGKEAGDSCGAAPDGGSCIDQDGLLYCEQSCVGRTDGDRCDTYTTGPGYCWSGECYPFLGGGGGIDGLGVDACGNVYASEFTSGIVWRIDPEGQPERLARLPSTWIPNVKWGRDQGGFSSTTLYVADRDHGRLFALPVGVPSAEVLSSWGAQP